MNALKNRAKQTNSQEIDKLGIDFVETKRRRRRWKKITSGALF